MIIPPRYKIGNGQERALIHIVHVADFPHRLIPETKRYVKAAHDKYQFTIEPDQIKHPVVWFIWPVVFHIFLPCFFSLAVIDSTEHIAPNKIRSILIIYLCSM